MSVGLVGGIVSWGYCWSCYQNKEVSRRRLSFLSDQICCASCLLTLAQVLVPEEAPDGSGSLMGCVVEARVASASRWSVKAEVLRVLYRPPAGADEQAGGLSGRSVESSSSAPPAEVAAVAAAASPATAASASGCGSLEPEQQGCGDTCACIGSPAAVGPAAAAATTLEPGGIAQPRQQEQQLPQASPACSSSSSSGSEAPPPLGSGLMAELSTASVLSDNSAVYPLARADASLDGETAVAAAAAGAIGQHGAVAKPAGSGGGLAEALLLLGLLVGLLGMLVSGVLAVLQP